MAVVIALSTGAQAGHHDPFFRMERVLNELKRVRTSLDRDAVHDPRVAVRPCCKFCQLLVTVYRSDYCLLV